MTEDPKTSDLANQSDPDHSPDPTGKQAKLISRRQVLTTGAASAVGLLVLPQAVQAGNRWRVQGQLAAPAVANTTRCTVAPTCSSPTLKLPSDTSFTFPELLTSCRNPPDEQCGDTSENTYRTLSCDLDLVEDEDTPSSGVYTRRFQIRGTNQPLLPAPTLCVYPGDQIALNILNDLSPNGDDTYCPVPLPDDLKNRPHCFNTSNIHFHGLHVSPLTYTPNGPVTGDQPEAKEPGAKSSDDVLFDLQPGEDHDWCIQLPDFHGPGTHWYHAHVHGTTALDVSNGVIGALIVQEPPGEEILAGAPDVVMVIQEILPALDCSSGDLTAQQCQDRGVYEQAGPGVGEQFLVNGVETPTLTIKNGEVQRWRLINGTGTPRGFMIVDVVKIEGSTKIPQTLYRVATDGITLYGKSMTSSDVEVTSYELSPGNRVDFFVNLPPGEYQLRKEPDPDVPATSASVLVNITVTEEDYDDGSLQNNFNTLLQGDIPGTPPCYLEPLSSSDAIDNPKLVAFQASNSPSPDDPITTPGFGNFRISDTKYGDAEAVMTVPLGDTQNWILANVIGNSPHPFHIHVNPFQIVETGTVTNYDSTQPISDTNPQINWDTTVDDGIWWDTISVPQGTAMKIRHRFWDYWGTFVLHCHILIHEDQGMMWKVDITNTNCNGIDPCETLAESVTDYTQNSCPVRRSPQRRGFRRRRGFRFPRRRGSR